jgi:tetratricopeptide (TPR) repeat protein
MRLLAIRVLVLSAGFATLVAFPAAPPSAHEEGLKLFALRRLDEARGVFERCRAEHPEDAQCLLYLGWVEMERRRWTDARRSFEAAVTLSPTNANFHLWLGRAYAFQAREAGIPAGLTAALRFKAALEKALILDPGHTAALVDHVQYCIDAPAFAGGGLNSARRSVRLLQSADLYLGQVAAARLLAAQKHWSEAFQTLRTAIDAAPGRLQARYALGQFQIKRQEFDNATRTYEAILAMQVRAAQPYDTRSDDALFHVAETAVLSGKPHPFAETWLRQYLQCRPDIFMPSLSQAHTLLAQLLARSDRLPEARDHFRQALQLNPDHGPAKRGLRDLERRHDR